MVMEIKSVERKVDYSKVRVTVGDRSFSMFTRGKSAWMENAAEEPQLIAAMRAGLHHEGAVAVQPDRAEAIALALAQAAPEDVVLIAGKGHEDYQEVRGQRRAFSDQAEARRALAQRGAAAGPAA